MPNAIQRNGAQSISYSSQKPAATQRKRAVNSKESKFKSIHNIKNRYKADLAEQQALKCEIENIRVDNKRFNDRLVELRDIFNPNAKVRLKVYPDGSEKFKVMGLGFLSSTKQRYALEQERARYEINKILPKNKLILKDEVGRLTQQVAKYALLNKIDDNNKLICKKEEKRDERYHEQSDVREAKIAADNKIAERKKAEAEAKLKSIIIDTIQSTGAGCAGMQRIYALSLKTDLRKVNTEIHGVMDDFRAALGYDKMNRKELKSFIMLMRSYAKDGAQLTLDAAERFYNPGGNTIELFRGAGITQAGINDILYAIKTAPPGRRPVFEFGRFTSASADKEVAQGFCDAKKHSRSEMPVMITIYGHSYHQPQPHPDFRYDRSEFEAVFAPAARVEVHKLTHSEGIYHLELREVEHNPNVPQQHVHAPMLPH